MIAEAHKPAYFRAGDPHCTMSWNERDMRRKQVTETLRLYVHVDYWLAAAGWWFRTAERDVEISGVPSKLFIIRGYTKLAWIIIS
jgi:hypothetical protein